MITDVEYLKGREKAAPLTPQMQANMERLLKAVNELFAKHYKGVYYGVSSGYRPASINAATKGAASHSAHLTCEAVDLRDPDQRISTFLSKNIPILEVLGLYMEAPASTPSWCHLQTRATKSGKRVFIP